MKTADAFFIFTDHLDCLTGNFTCSHTFHILHNFFSHFFSTFIYVKSECFSYNFFSQMGRQVKTCRPLLIYGTVTALSLKIFYLCKCFISVWLCILTLLIWLFFILLFKAYQDNITSDLAYIAKGDHIFLFSS